MLLPENYERILLERDQDGVVVATLNRPEKLNAVDARMHTELSRLAYDLDADPDAKVLVLTGAGRGFCAGGDFTDDPVAADNSAMMLEGRRIVDHMLECRKPLIAAVNGYAMGLGATIALLCDVVYAARSAVIADTHVLAGLSAGDGGQVLWPFLVGMSRARYHLMTGDRLTAEEAERIGLINFVVDDDQLLDTAVGLARRFATGPYDAVVASKVPINQWLRAQSALIVPFSIQMEERGAIAAASKMTREQLVSRPAAD